MDRQQFFNMIQPYAVKVSKALDIPVSVVMAQWGLESQYGSSLVYQNNNNLAGIKHVGSSIDVGVSPSGYAKYRDLNQFADDYIRVMNNGYYNGVKSAGSVEETATALGNSPWAEGRYKDTNGTPGGSLLGVIAANNLKQYDSSINSPYGLNLDLIGQSFANMNADELKLYASIGAVAMAVYWMMKK